MIHPLFEIIPVLHTVSWKVKTWKFLFMMVVNATFDLLKHSFIPLHA